LKENQRQLPRMLIVWSGLPCNHLGAGILMRRLFVEYSHDLLWALTTYQSKRGLASYDPVPPPKRQIPVPEIHIPRRWIDKLAHVINFLLIPWTVWRGVQLMRKEKIEAIFTVPWSQFTIAAYFIHRITHLPIYMYIMDDPEGARRADGSQALLYRTLMPRLVRACKRVWGVSHGMCEYFEKNYGVKCVCLLPPLDLDTFQRKSAESKVSADGTLHVVFTGSIYSAQVDSVRRLVRVVDHYSGRNGDSDAKMRLTLYTDAPVKALERLGVMGKNVRRDEVKHEDIANVLARADVAFLPLSFESNMRHIVETSFPSKIAEYLASGVPILVHAPSYSAAARYCVAHACGLVVDEPSEASLQDALLRLSTDAALRTKLSAGAIDTAVRNHDANQIVPSFLRSIG
jgi:glycosyltransferase involved in cell wall biosynthesis